MNEFRIDDIELTKYIFFTGKGGVGKTSTACATAVRLADMGKKVLLISTDPASNLQDVFGIPLDNKGVKVEEIPNLIVVNLDPITAAAEYKESVVAPFRGKLPESALISMEEQLSGSCTVEIAAFNEFSKFITDDSLVDEYEFIVFDTAPTGHTLRLLQLPSAWTDFISENNHGASCLGQLSGLDSKKEIYQKAVKTLADGYLTTLILVSRPEETPLKEANRASKELDDLGIKNQLFVLNGMLSAYDDDISEAFYQKQQNAIQNIPERLLKIPTYMIPLRAYNITGIEQVRGFLNLDNVIKKEESLEYEDFPSFNDIIDEISQSGKKVIFTMGKGGVGKTTIAASIALGLAKRGKSVHLTTTDPAAHLDYLIDSVDNITMSHIDEKEELKKYQDDVLNKARETMSEDDLAYIEEDLKSPCTQEIAVFRAFAEIVEDANGKIVVIDTAPTGHTLLLLESTKSYNNEIKRSNGDIPEAVKNLLPRLKNGDETEVIIVTLPEATPFFEASRLEEDLKRAGIFTKWWIINSSLYQTNTTNRLLAAKASNEVEWINKIGRQADGAFTIVPWSKEELKNDTLLCL